MKGCCSRRHGSIGGEEDVESSETFGLSRVHFQHDVSMAHIVSMSSRDALGGPEARQVRCHTGSRQGRRGSPPPCAAKCKCIRVAWAHRTCHAPFAPPTATHPLEGHDDGDSALSAITSVRLPSPPRRDARDIGEAHHILHAPLHRRPLLAIGPGASAPRVRPAHTEPFIPSCP